LLTRSGLGALLVACVLAVTGVVWEYEELLISSFGVAFVVGFAVVIARRAPRTAVERRLRTVRVARGDPVQVTYRFRNNTDHRSGRASLADECDGASVNIPIAPVASGDLYEQPAQIPTRRRGVFELGPLDIEKIDPFHLAIGRWRQRQDSSLLHSITVHPKVYEMSGPRGAARVVENESIVRRAAQDPMSGFVSMREYVAGDDPRMIHWPTTARTGTLMVREHMEVRRPEYTIVVDTAASASSEDDFEEIVDVAATLAVHALRTGLDVVVRTTSRQFPGQPRSLAAEADVLDLLTPVQRTDDPYALASLFRQGLDHTSVLLVTGPDGPTSRVSDTLRTTTIRVGHDARQRAGIALAVQDAPEFVRRWRSWT
jgi:uncharacterized protein (DUF58 family)